MDSILMDELLENSVKILDEAKNQFQGMANQIETFSVKQKNNRSPD
jgi:hypothetical protein